MLRAFPVLAICVLLTQNLVASESDFFEKRIRPVLHERCVDCHGARKQKGGLRLDSREAMVQGGDSGPALVPGDPEESLILKAVRHTDADLKMPPSKAGPKLTDEVIADLAAWVKSGAPWTISKTPAAANAKDAFNLEARKQRLPWIWQTPRRQAVPEIASPSPLDEVDRFILAKLREKGIAPALPTDDLTWLRRVHFAITGLPPSREDMRGFLRDRSPERREHVVDALLASPHFGERWARHWMDLVRYAESRGHESDYPIANAWRYRDYLIRAFNADLPYDRFVAEHIAGDILKPRIDPSTGANESVVATGWAFLGEEVHSPVDIRQDECDRVDNKVDVLSKTFLGLTVACARCHDHKFDAITQRDYYALSGFVLGSTFRQVRFETMEPHSEAAKALATLREQFAGRIRIAFTEAAKPKIASMAPYLLAARRVSLGEKREEVVASLKLHGGQLGALIKQLDEARITPSHPLHDFSTLLAAPNPFKAPWTTAPSRNPGSTVRTLPADAKVIADYTGPSGTSWKTDGPGFGTRPLAAGESIFGTEERPIARVMPYGAATLDRFWDRLTLTPGTERDSGRLGATERSGRTLLTPKVTLGVGRLHYLIRGKAQVYASVDSHLMVEGPLHGVLVSKFDSGPQPRWVSHDLRPYAGHRVHLEFSPVEKNDLDVLMVVESTTPPAWLPVEPWRPSSDRNSFEAVATALLADCATALEALKSEKPDIPPALASLADWIAQHPEAIGLDSPQSGAADYFREQEKLASKIRWDSPTAVSWADGFGVDENVLIRGKPTRPGAIASRRLPEAFGLPPIDPKEASGRAELATQLIDPSNPLVARVMVNRVWHQLFGRGIVATVDNFGYLGERPTHPELLDHLTWQFVHDEGWSVKSLIRRLVLTETFARSSRPRDPKASELDPANLLLHHMPVRRLEGEAIRDALLCISGRLDPKTYGPPIPVHLTEFIVGRGRPEVSGPADGAGRRSVYQAARRNFLPSMMLAFDLPTPFSTVGRRNVTNVPAQSLVMMNDPFVHEQAKLWASRLLKELPQADPTGRIHWLFETGYGRPPTEEEVKASLESFADLRTAYTGEPESAAWSEFCHALLGANDFIYLK